MEKALPKTATTEAETVKPLPRAEVIRGSVRAEYRRCGKPNCRCASAGDPGHGPYYYRYFRARGRLTKRYVPRGEAAAVATACRERRERRRESRRLLSECLAALREIDRLLPGAPRAATDRDLAGLRERLYG
jgi:hypothetical protein